jgi:glycosyltransferase involved in cell wall biosynthesis
MQPEVINVQSRDDFIAATKVAKKMGARVFWTDHMDFRSWVLINVKKWYKNWVGKWVLKEMREVDDVIMISDHEREWLEKQVAPRKYSNIITIKNGVADRRDDYKNVKPEPESFIYVGRIVNYKGIGELLEAFRSVVKEYPNVRLNMYGNGEDYEKYSKLSSDLEQVQFFGITDEPLKVLAENDIFVLPSYREGLSLSLLDAAMMGKKIIASDVDGNPEVVKNKKTGILVPAKNASELAMAMKWVLKNSKKAEIMAANVRKEFEEEYDFNKIFAEKMLPLYNMGKEKK